MPFPILPLLAVGSVALALGADAGAVHAVGTGGSSPPDRDIVQDLLEELLPQLQENVREYRAAISRGQALGPSGYLALGQSIFADSLLLVEELGDRGADRTAPGMLSVSERFEAVSCVAVEVIESEHLAHMLQAGYLSPEAGDVLARLDRELAHLLEFAARSTAMPAMAGPGGSSSVDIAGNEASEHGSDRYTIIATWEDTLPSGKAVITRRYHPWILDDQPQPDPFRIERSIALYLANNQAVPEPSASPSPLVRSYVAKRPESVAPWSPGSAWSSGDTAFFDLEGFSDAELRRIAIFLDVGHRIGPRLPAEVETAQLPVDDLVLGGVARTLFALAWMRAAKPGVPPATDFSLEHVKAAMLEAPPTTQAAKLEAEQFLADLIENNRDRLHRAKADLLPSGLLRVAGFTSFGPDLPLVFGRDLAMDATAVQRGASWDETHAGSYDLDIPAFESKLVWPAPFRKVNYGVTVRGKDGVVPMDAVRSSLEAVARSFGKADVVSSGSDHLSVLGSFPLTAQEDRRLFGLLRDWEWAADPAWGIALDDL